jgi:two-component system phosphate regulon sensor histidine kinase PhoR
MAINMTEIGTFAGGATVGAIACYWWQKSQWQEQLDHLLRIMGDRGESNPLSMIAQLRRKIADSQVKQEMLAQQLESARTLLDRSPIGYLQVDGENQILSCNPIAQQLLHINNWSAQGGKVLLKLVPSYELDRAIENTRYSQQIGQLEWQFHPRYVTDGDSTAQWLRAITIPMAGGEVGVFIDSQQSQVDAAKAQSRWIADLAHELRTPLTSIRLVAETLQAKVDPSLQRWVERMLPEIQRSIDLIQNFLDLSHLETSPSQYLEVKELDVVEVIGLAWQTLEPIAQQRQISLNYDGLDRGILTADAARLTQVFLNLFDNSIKYSPDGGEINVRTRQLSGDYILDPSVAQRRLQDFPAIWLDVPAIGYRSRSISHNQCQNIIEIDIYDRGGGFKPADLPYVFDRLFRGDPARYCDPQTGKEITAKSNGLGLAIVRQIILAHGGTIVARNHPETGGAWMQINLPIASE